MDEQEAIPGIESIRPAVKTCGQSRVYMLRIMQRINSHTQQSAISIQFDNYVIHHIYVSLYIFNSHQYPPHPSIFKSSISGGQNPIEIEKECHQNKKRTDKIAISVLTSDYL